MNRRGLKLRLGGLVAVLALGLLLVAGLVAGGEGETTARAAKPKSPTRDVIAISNNWDGTIDLVDAHSFKRLKRLNVVPDREERMAEIATNPDRLTFFL